MKRLWLALALALAACGGGGSLPPVPGPAPVPAPTTVLWQADLTGPSIGVGLACDEAVPPACVGSAPILTFDRPGKQGQECVDPGPNPCWAADRGLRFFADDAGWPFISNDTFDGAFLLEAEVSLTCVDTGCFAGPVPYNGEDNYAAVYLAWAPGDRVQPYLYRTHFTVPLGSETFAPGTVVRLGVSYRPGGRLGYIVNGVEKDRETPEAPLGIDSPILSNPPRAALFMGGGHGQFNRWSVYRLP